MINHNTPPEFFLSCGLILLLLLFLNPFGWWMPDSFLMMMVIALILLFALFTSFMWKENALDEREYAHRMLAGRIAFLVGAGVLILGITVQSLGHRVDAWLIFTLCAMILAKIGGIVYSRVKY